MGIIVQNKNQEDKKTVHYSLVGTKNLLLIFTRNPVLGECKTRLAATIGNEAALEVYKFLLQHTFTISKNITAGKQVYYSEDIWPDDVWDTMYYDKKLQLGEDLGERMSNAFQDGFASKFEKIIVIGSDMYDLSQSDIEAAFTALDKNDYVIGPAIDGGYYLLGMRKVSPKLFQNKTWGQSEVLESTLKDLEGESVKLLDPRNDIDLYEDIKDQEVFYPFIKHMKA